MPFRTRLILLVALLLVTVTAATSGILAWQTRNTLLAEAERTGARIAGLLARSATFGAKVSQETEHLVGQMMVAQGHIAAAYVAAATRAKTPLGEMTDTLTGITEKTVIDEFWITDEKGHAYLTTVPDTNFTFLPNAEAQPQAHEFWPLLKGRELVIQDARKREIDNLTFKYVGVSGFDQPRIIQLGVEVGFLQRIADRVGLKAMVETLVTEGGIDAIWVLGEGLHPLAHATVLGAETSSPPTEAERQKVHDVIASGQSRSLVTDVGLSIVAPMQNGRTATGAAVVRLSTRHLDTVLTRQAWSALAVVVAALFIGSLLVVVMAQRATEPLIRLGKAAKELESGDFQPTSLNDLKQRNDEFGTLGKLFQHMAEEVKNREIQLETKVSERTADLKTAHQRIDKELEIAQSFQTSILPTAVARSADHEIYGVMIPAREMSGDFYDHFPLDEHRYCVVIGDVSGKGVPAALFMVLARTALQAVAAHGDGPGTILARLNDQLVASNPIELFVTLFFGIYDSRDGSLIYASGGHPPPWRLKTDGIAEPLEHPGGIALGVMEDMEFPEIHTEVNTGETLFLYTDGITEAFDAEGNAFGESRLSEALSTTRHLSAEALAFEIATLVERFAKGTEQADDITCLVLRRQGVVKVSARLDLIMIDDLGEIPRILDALADWGTEQKMATSLVSKLQLVCDEILANIAAHAWEQQGGHEIRISLSRGGGKVKCVFRDDGRPFNPLGRSTPDISTSVTDRPIGGLGIHLTRQLMDDVVYRQEEGDNILTLTISE